MDRQVIGILVATGAVAAAGAGIMLLRRRRQRIRDLQGLWTTETEKLQRARPDEFAIVWKLPPGPPPRGPERNRRKHYKKLCAAGGGPRKWMRPMAPKGAKPPDPLNKPENQPLPWWIGGGGTCPGASYQCGASCYAATRKNYYDWAVRRPAWVNLCDVVAGKGLPRIREAELPGETGAIVQPLRKQEWNPKWGPEAKPVGRLASDYWSNELVVDPRKIRKIFVRVHETGDFFDRKYAQLWWKYANDYVNKYYKREMERYLRGERDTRPPMILWWAYSRSWRDPKILPELRRFSLIRYPRIDAERCTEKGCERVEIAPRDAFSILLSADADTGVPWIKDERGRIMPVAYLLAKNEGLEAAAQRILNRVPGIIFQDVSLRREVIGGGRRFGTPVCPAEARKPEWQAEIDEVLRRFEIPDERTARSRLPSGEYKYPEAAEALEVIDAKYKRGCGRCSMCMPESIQRLTDQTWQRFVNASRAGLDLSQIGEMDLLRRADDITEYERFMQSPEVAVMAVPPMKEFAERVMQISQKSPWRLERLRELAARKLAEKAPFMPVVDASGKVAA